MDDDFFAREYDTDPVPKKHDHLFLWTILILLLIGVALAAWLGSFYVFGHPEKPFSYKWLKKLHKVEPPLRFELTEAPPGRFYTAQAFFDKFATYTPFDLEQENSKLLRAYIKNYTETKALVPYIIGRFNIIDSYELKPGDMFPSGVVALAQSVDFPRVLIEHAYTAPKETVPQLQSMLAPGLDIRLARTLDLSAVIHIEKLRDGRLQLTVVPLLYGSYALKRGTGGFSLEPPPDLNMQAGVPILNAAAIHNALRTYAENRRETNPGDSALRMPAPPTAEASATPSEPELVQLAPVPTPSASPVMGVTPIVVKPLITIATPTPRPKPTPVLIAANTTPQNTIPEPPAVPAVPTPAPVSPSGVPLKPFIQSAPAPNAMTAGGGAWKTFAPGQMPRGKLLKVGDAADLADRGLSGDVEYLEGDFVVTAAGENRAVLRSRHGASSAVRVFVEYPAGFVAPSEGTEVTRAGERPFEIREIRRGADGTVNVYAREITNP